MGTTAAVISCLLFSTCGPPEPGPPPLPDAKFAASYERSGGLKPMPQKVVFSPGRKAAVTTLDPTGKPRTVRFRLPILKLHQFRNALSQPKFALYESHLPGTCADCYLYSIAYRGHSITFVQTEIPIWIRKTVYRFEALVESHRPFH